ncbi:MAG: VOC family protein [Pseudomonadota bacterium]
MSKHGEIHWSELVSDDVEGSKAFFSKMAGWEINDMPMPDGNYSVCMVDGVPTAGIMSAAQIQADHPVPPHWMTYIAVDDVDAAASGTAASGGEVVRPAFDVPGVGRIAIVKDPGGALVGIMTPAPQEG